MEENEVIVQPTKKWYASKTMGVNAIVVIVMALQVITGTQVLEPDIQALLVALLNILLRFQTVVPIK